MQSGALRHRVAFDAEQLTPDGAGGNALAWVPQHECAAAFIYQRGAESVDAGALTGTATFKVKFRSCVAARSITPEYRMRDVRRGIAFNIREIDAISDPAWIWIVVESGLAI